MLKGNQVKLDKNKDGKISGKDFKMMKSKKGSMAQKETWWGYNRNFSFRFVRSKIS
tara:strand:+ start:147 stop:314 length:168 start_codon:yes stop_codon:yes gene_type:complete